MYSRARRASDLRIAEKKEENKERRPVIQF